MDFNPEWITTLADDHILRVPPEFSPNTEKLEIKIPSTWSNPYTGNEEQTQLPSLFDWWLTNHHSTPHARKNALHRTPQKIAADADLTHRPMVTGSRGRTVPRVAPKDLRHTHGIHLARNGASGEWIARRMGLDRPEQAEVYFALLEHHDRY
jgi:integrase